MFTSRHICMPMRALLILAMLTVATAMHAATEFTIDQLTTIDGLANNTVRYIMQDSKGRMWFATSNGASVYDGRTFTSLRPEIHRSPIGMQDQRVTCITEDSKGRIWIYTQGGLCCFDPKIKHFIDYHALGIATPQDRIRSKQKVTDAHGRTWSISHDSGLYVTEKDGHTMHYTTSSDNNPLPTNNLKCIFVDDKGIIWIGTDNLGISRITTTQNEGADYILEGHNIRTLTSLDNGTIAAANKNGDVWMYDGLLNKVTGHSIYKHSTYCMIETKGQHLWQGTKGGGLLLDSEPADTTIHKEIYSLLATSDTCLWIGTFGDGLIIYNPAKRKVAHHLLLGSYTCKRVRHLATDRDKQIWAATSDGAYVFTRPKSATQSPRQKAHLCVAEGSLTSDEVRTLCVDTKGRVYIAEAGKGFAIWDKGHISHYTPDDGLVNDMVQCFIEDRQGFMWIATELGISRFNPATKQCRNYFFSKDMLKNVFNENSGAILADGRIAFGSNSGILIISPSIYNANDSVYGVNEDDIAVNGRPVHHDTRYIITSWWRSPWARAGIALLALAILAASALIRSRHSRFRHTISMLSTKKDELAEEARILTRTNDELAAQKKELNEEKERLASDIRIERSKEQTATERAFIDKMEMIADEQIANPDFSADDFAAQMGMGRTVFFKKMKELTGYSPAGYMRSRRIHQAARLISTTSLTISEIATKVGINDALYLSRIFRAEYKCSPTEWRNRTQQEPR